MHVIYVYREREFVLSVLLHVGSQAILFVIPIYRLYSQCIRCCLDCLADSSIVLADFDLLRCDFYNDDSREL